MQKLVSWLTVTSLLWIIGFLHNRYLDPEVAWIRSIYEVKVGLARQQDGQRLLIAGGSGTHFGVNTLKIEEVVKRPTLNMGLHAGLGLNTILASTLEEVRKGDIILVIPEYGILASDGTGGFSSSFSAAIGQPGLGGFGSEQKAREMVLMGVPGADRMLQSIKYGVNNLITQQTNSKLDKTNNSYTIEIDRRGNPLKLPSGAATSLVIQEPASEMSIHRLMAFRQKIQDANAKLILALSWVLSTDKHHSLENIKTTANSLKKIAPLLYAKDYNRKSDLILFGDKFYHLTEESRSIRSMKLAEQLKSFIRKQNL